MTSQSLIFLAPLIGCILSIVVVCVLIVTFILNAKTLRSLRSFWESIDKIIDIELKQGLEIMDLRDRMATLEKMHTMPLNPTFYGLGPGNDLRALDQSALVLYEAEHDYSAGFITMNDGTRMASSSAKAVEAGWQDLADRMKAKKL